MSIVKGYGLDGRGSILSSGKRFAFGLTLEPVQRPVQLGSRAHYLTVNQLGCEADHLPPSSAEVKKS
jgi:hypothetical protein